MLIVVHFGAEQETNAWASGRYELTRRAFPQQTVAARHISPEDARNKLAAKFCEWHSNSAPIQLARLFGWTKVEAVAASESVRQPAKQIARIKGPQ
jgi:hypothetical protein